MKKNYLLAAALCLASTAMAQSIDNPLSATIGVNTHNATQKGCVYWQFTADKDYIATVSPYNDGEVPFVAVKDGANLANLKGIFAPDYTSWIFLFEKGKTYNFSLIADAAAELGFALKLEETSNLGVGLSADNPLEIKLGETQAFGNPFYPEDSWDEVNIYSTYKAQKDGQLQIKTAQYVNTAVVNGQKVSFENEGELKVFKINTKAGESYAINFTIGTPFFIATSQVVEVKEGSIDMPYTLSEGENTIPAEAGKYFYTFAPKQKGYINLQSEAAAEGAQVKVFRNKIYATSGKNAVAESEVGSYNVRAEIDNIINTYYIVVDKPNASAKAETFKFQTESYKPGETADSAIPVEISDAGASVTLPAANGTYYYSINVPANTNKYLVVEPTTKLSEGSKAYVNLYSHEYGATFMTNNIIKRDVSETKDKSYFFVVKSKEEAPLSFNIKYAEIEKGALISNPKPAVLGVNTIDYDDAEHYVYTATKSGKLAVEVAEGVTVKFPLTASGYGTNDTYVKGNTFFIEATKGKEYLISLSNVAKGSTFTLAETEFEAGELRSNPILMTADTYTLGEFAGNLWLKYEVSKDGVIDFSSDAPCDYNSFIGIAKNEALSPVSMTDNVQGTPTPGSTWIPREQVFQSLFPVAKGDVLYIQVMVPQDSKGKKLTLNLRAPEAGETIECPIVLKKGETLDVSKASLRKPIFVKANLTKGKNTFEMAEGSFTPQRNCTLDPESGMTYRGGEVNWEEDGIHFVENALRDTEVTFMIGYAEGKAKMKFVNDTVDGIFSIEAVQDSKPSIYTLDGTKIDQINGNGVYIIKMNGKTKKVVIKK